MKKKICTKCGNKKEYSEFSKLKRSKDGISYSCKSCEKAYREKNKEKAKDYRDSHKEESKAYRDSHKKEMAVWHKNFYKENKEELKLKRKIYQQTPRGKELRKIFKKKWQKENPLKHKAHRILQKAVARGNIIKPINCSVCNKTNCKISGHHEDYSKPLEAVWVCDDCHPYLDEQRRLRELNSNM